MKTWWKPGAFASSASGLPLSNSFCSAKGGIVRLIAGVILIHAAEQAYGHAFLIQFPHQGSASQVLIPASGVLLVFGLLLTAWGIIPEKHPASVSK